MQEFPFRIAYEGEKACDTGGVCRDMFSAFWPKAYLHHFDGERLLVPSTHPGVDMSNLHILGAIISQGFMVCGFLPIRIAFPVLAAILLGPEVNVPDCILIESFVDFLSMHEGNLLRDAISSHSLSPSMKTSMVDLLSRFGITDVPTSQNLHKLAAKHYFLGQTFSTLFKIRRGVPKPYHAFFEKYGVAELFSIYKALNASTSSVLKLIKEPTILNSAEQRIYSYLTTYVGNMKCNELRNFLRFVTGSSVMVAQPINISFNCISGFVRRPISHACDCGLELSIDYSTYMEFEVEFTTVLHNKYSWIMDSI